MFQNLKSFLQRYMSMFISTWSDNTGSRNRLQLVATRFSFRMAPGAARIQASPVSKKVGGLTSWSVPAG